MTYQLTRMPFNSTLLGTVTFLLAIVLTRTFNSFEMDSYAGSSVTHGQNSNVDTENGSSGSLDLTSQSPINVNKTRFKFQDDPRIFKLWVKPFHWNFMQYLPAYIQWRTYLDGTVIPEHYKDEACGLFEANQMGSWRLRRLIKRRDDRSQCELARLQPAPVLPLPPPEPHPTWNEGWFWETDTWWGYTVLDPFAEPPDNCEEWEAGFDLPDTYWTQLVSNFVDSHNPACIVQLVTDMFSQSVDQEREVSINLLDPKPYWKQICSRVLVHAINLPRAYTGTIKNGLPLIVDTGASVCITPRQEDFIFY